MRDKINRRDFIKLAGIGGVVFASGLGFDAIAKAQHGKLSPPRISGLLLCPTFRYPLDSMARSSIPMPIRPYSKQLKVLIV
ncbi:twin-arginine translocation signal domain-containing protein [Methylomonas paludis]|uniref:Twin-arginine translocation signal domain-containing protein n=1 Tax=Methylomonas paludis TaxID=1173101 RepID=A0A975MMF6_9GAMM|nr:twin-arginine translocation signal domain-containing protein [Methylomonas paludis]